MDTVVTALDPPTETVSLENFGSGLGDVDLPSHACRFDAGCAVHGITKKLMASRWIVRKAN